MDLVPFAHPSPLTSGSRVVFMFVPSVRETKNSPRLRNIELLDRDGLSLRGADAEPDVAVLRCDAGRRELRQQPQEKAGRCAELIDYQIPFTVAIRHGEADSHASRRTSIDEISTTEHQNSSLDGACLDPPLN